MKFLDAKGQFDIELFRRTVRTMILAMEILVDASSYPTATIARNSHDFRPLGLGYANLGALLMHYGLAYDSDAGRTLAAAVSAFLSAEGYHMSAEIAKRVGPFPGFEQEPLADAARDGQARGRRGEDPAQRPAPDPARRGRGRPMARHGEGRRALGLP